MNSSLRSSNKHKVTLSTSESGNANKDIRLVNRNRIANSSFLIKKISISPNKDLSARKLSTSIYDFFEIKSQAQKNKSHMSDMASLLRSKKGETANNATCCNTGRNFESASRNNKLPVKM